MDEHPALAYRKKKRCVDHGSYSFGKEKGDAVVSAGILAQMVAPLWLRTYVKGLIVRYRYGYARIKGAKLF